jgi:hypothetical protein
MNRHLIFLTEHDLLPSDQQITNIFVVPLPVDLLAPLATVARGATTFAWMSLAHIHANTACICGITFQSQDVTFYLGQGGIVGVGTCGQDFNHLENPGS